MNQYDLIVVGLGAMGSAALYQASERGARALGIDRFDPPHTMGSSHGDTRITRQAIGEGEMYMPFIRRSNEIWRDLELSTGQKLFLESGGLIIAPESDAASFHVQGNFVALSVDIAEQYGIPHEVLDAGEIKRRFPMLTPGPVDRAYYEPGAGVLRPERCIQTQLELARQAGAAIGRDERMIRYQADARGVTVATDKGSYRADKLILSTGAWIGDLLPESYRAGIRVCRQVIYWFEAENLEAFYPENCPFVIWIGDRLEDFWSTFPVPRDGVRGVKLVTEQYHTSTHADELNRQVTAEETADMYHRLTAPRLKGLRENLIRADVCMYTVSVDEHFVIDRHPGSERVVIASPCSGHGFKHSAAVGETLVQLALDGGSDIDISAFALARLGDIQE
ncbi:MAG: N-methyl-L-tryptophan oxidase [Chloroflexota bacterium]|nr:N-methyl-L-tryptophan oxidase [Chloroflexota bacterium]MDE2857397.1 N-methyl-L-tryptophan oxidase [Chloroflexota bacterium]